MKLHILQTLCPAVKENILLFTFPDLVFRRGKAQRRTAGCGRVRLCQPSCFSDGEAPVPTATVLPSACSNLNLFACSVRTGFFSRGSVVKTCIAFDSVMFVFSVKVLSNIVGDFLVSRAF